MKTEQTVVTLYLLLISSWEQADNDRRAEPFDSHFEVSHLEYDMNAGGIHAEPHGYRLNLSVNLTDSFYAVVDRKSTSEKRPGPDYDFETEGYGFGFHGDAWYASYTYNTWDVGGNEFDVNTVRLGFRRHVTNYLEFNASYSWNDFDDADNHDGFQVGLAVRLTDNFKLVTEYETIGGKRDVDYFSAGVRLTF